MTFNYAWKIQRRIENKLKQFTEHKYYDMILIDCCIMFTAGFFYFVYGGFRL